MLAYYTVVLWCLRNKVIRKIPEAIAIESCAPAKRVMFSARLSCQARTFFHWARMFPPIVENMFQPAFFFLLANRVWSVLRFEVLWQLMKFMRWFLFSKLADRALLPRRDVIICVLGHSSMWATKVPYVYFRHSRGHGKQAVHASPLLPSITQNYILLNRPMAMSCQQSCC